MKDNEIIMCTYILTKQWIHQKFPQHLKEFEWLFYYFATNYILLYIFYFYLFIVTTYDTAVMRTY